MTKLAVDIKKIDEVGDDMMIELYCHKPEQKSVSWSVGLEELDRNNSQFQTDSKQHQQNMKEYKKEIHKIHIGHALLIQDQDVKEGDI